LALAGDDAEGCEPLEADTAPAVQPTATEAAESSSSPTSSERRGRTGRRSFIEVLQWFQWLIGGGAERRLDVAAAATVPCRQPIDPPRGTLGPAAGIVESPGERIAQLRDSTALAQNPTGRMSRVRIPP
jgi:hypothetical protein